MEHVFKIRQLEFEVNCWIRLLDFIQDENTHCRLRLADVLNTKTSNANLKPQVSYYEERYREQDAHLSLLNKNLYLLSSLLHQNTTDQNAIPRVMETYHLLSEEINKAEHDFFHTKEDFAVFLSSIVQLWI